MTSLFALTFSVVVTVGSVSKTYASTQVPLPTIANTIVKDIEDFGFTPPAIEATGSITGTTLTGKAFVTIEGNEYDLANVDEPISGDAAIILGILNGLGKNPTVEVLANIVPIVAPPVVTAPVAQAA